ncbi:hypothetical protein HOR33_gp05 [Klebsiella phage vB_KpnP_IL33]|uniref:Uncharacterized protein n=2 Tax=Przondovirus TaxID=1985720 RepID=A0A1V0E6H1_9CAUD|nr:hypothetical protein HOR32_gp05 [Klebsiella phage vB_KpnP_BIS33]YP_009787507.1 hypothetical protein HOR33_gp05 [Klebsiella phage vB_KpnP_IL33]ARB12414.1 hypothetical protein IL33_05 [Klebsiella phage vB_KpnP_IL33]ARB12460.1 hypothetical protein BIS33_05 [Klebsiella phage vB_KpnP_BIS33]
MSQRINTMVYKDGHGRIIVHIIKDDIFRYVDDRSILPYYPGAETRKTWKRIGTNIKFTD